DHHLSIGDGDAYRLGGLIFGRVVAVLRGLEGRKLDHDVSAPAPAFHCLVGTAAREEIRPVFLERRLGGGDIVLVAIRVAYVDMGNPVGLGHCSPFPQSSLAGVRQQKTKDRSWTFVDPTPMSSAPASLHLTARLVWIRPTGRLQSAASHISFK